ncbi:MAG: ABC transporter permease [Alphaproteobacteria bacterium]|nr:ABC transporter permease [Alphaproteobacteria bacterium]
MNLAYRDIRHNAGRFALTCAGLGMLLGVVLAMIGIYRGLVVDALTLVRAPQADLWIVEADRRGPFAESSRIPGDTREAIERIHGVAAAGSVTYMTTDIEAPGGRLRFQIVGYEPGRPGGPPALVAGRPLARSHFDLVADTSTGLVPGNTLMLGRNRFTVTGLTAGQVTSSGDPVVYVSLLDSQKLQFELAPPAARVEMARGAGSGSRDTVNAVIARVEANVAAGDVARTVQRWKHLNAITQAEQEDILTRSVVQRARRQIGLFTSILLVVSAVIISLIIYTMTMDKIREIATLKLIGAPDRTIITMIVQQAVILGAAGFLAGAMLISLVKDYFPRRVILQPEDGLALAAVVLAVCLVSSGLGVRLALTVDPARALGG